MRQLRLALLTFLVIPCLVLVLPVGATATVPAPQDEVVGDWGGALSVGSASLRIVFHITRGEDGGLTATMDSPDQNAFGIAVDTATFEDGTLKLGIAAIAGGYEGQLAEQDTIQGTWSQGGQSLPLDLTRQKE